VEDMKEVRWHGRGGQGAVTAAKILAESALAVGKYVQAFPEYGAERMGAPVKAFTRISSTPIVIHSQIEEPDVVTVLDMTLFGAVDILEGLKPDGALVVNTHKNPGEIRSEIDFEGRKLYVLDATQISLDEIGKDLPNTPLVGAMVKVLGGLDVDAVADGFAKKYGRKFTSKVIEGNVNAMKRAYEEVKSE